MNDKWQLVPIVPTEEMRRAYYACVPERTGPIHAATQKWNAMISAAPPSELVKAAEALRDFVKKDVRWNDERDRLLAELDAELEKVKL